MIFDDHDIRDDWNASLSWKRKMEATSWWHERIVAGLASYWVYQHLGNLSPRERPQDELWQQVAGRHDAASLDLSAELDEFAERCDQDPNTYRWSFCRDFGDTRLIVVDSRAARDLTPDGRGLLNAQEMAWFDGQHAGRFPPRAGRDVAARSCCRWACTTSSHGMRPSPRAPGATGRAGRRTAAAGRGPGTLGGVPEQLPGGGRNGDRGRRRQPRPVAANCHLPLR